MPLTITVPPVPPDYVTLKAFYRMYAKKTRWFRMWLEITQKSKEEAAAEAFDVSRTFYLERQARLCAEKTRRVARYAEIADSGVDDVAHALERERMMFVDQQAGDSDYSDCDEDGRNNGLAARVAREALFMESREANAEALGLEFLEEVVAVLDRMENPLERAIMAREVVVSDMTYTIFNF